LHRTVGVFALRVVVQHEHHQPSTQLAQQAKELGIEIDLNYSFAQPKKTDE